MSQSFRRTLVWTVIAVLLLLGTLMQLKAAPHAAAPDANAEQKLRQSMLSRFACTVSLLTFRLAQAEEACGETIALLPESPLGYKNRGYVYLLERRFERAEADFREAVKLDPRDADNQAGLGQALSDQGRFDEAVEKFGAALKLQPRDVRYLAARCWSLAGQGKNLKAALADCDRAIALAPHSAVAYDARGLVNLKRNKNVAAVLDYSTSLRLAKAQPSALFGRGIAEARLGRLSSAWSDLNLARARNPEIDETYILVGVLEESCRADTAPCSLPPALRARPSQSSPPYLSVSFRERGER